MTLPTKWKHGTYHTRQTYEATLAGEGKVVLLLLDGANQECSMVSSCHLQFVLRRNIARIESSLGACYYGIRGCQILYHFFFFALSFFFFFAFGVLP